MAGSLSVDDVVMVKINPLPAVISSIFEIRPSKQRIGIIKYIKLKDSIHGNGLNNHIDWIGLELIEPLPFIGHNGTIDGHYYFDCDPEYGIHIPITNVIKKLKASDVAKILQQNPNLKMHINHHVEIPLL